MQRAFWAVRRSRVRFPSAALKLLKKDISGKLLFEMSFFYAVLKSACTYMVKECMFGFLIACNSQAGQAHALPGIRESRINA